MNSLVDYDLIFEWVLNAAVGGAGGTAELGVSANQYDWISGFGVTSRASNNIVPSTF